MNREAMRQAAMKQVQTMPTAAIRQVENCLLLLHGCRDEDTAAPARQKDSHKYFSHQEQRAEYQRNKYAPWPLFSLAGPGSLSLWFPDPFPLLATAEEHLCLPEQPAGTCPRPVLQTAIPDIRRVVGAPKKDWQYRQACSHYRYLILKFPACF